MANVTFATVPMDDYLYCRLCRCDVGKANDGPRLHAEQRHPDVRFDTLYTPSAPRSVIAGEADERVSRPVEHVSGQPTA